MGRACAQLIETLEFGGAESLAVRIANGLADARWDSHLVITGCPGPLADRVDPSVKIHYLGLDRAPLHRIPAFCRSLRRGYASLASLLDAEGISVVQTHLPGANFWGLLIALFRKTAVFPTIHNNEEFNYGDADDPVRKQLRRLAYRLMIRRCAATIAVSRQVESSMARELSLGAKDRSRMVVVSNGVPIPGSLDRGVREEVRRRYGIPERSLLVLAAGRLCEQKNHSDLVAAAARLDDQVYDLRFIIAGEGPLRERLERQIADAGLVGQVVLTGAVRDLPDLMASADIFVLPSLWEGLPLVLLEAMASGTPVLGNAIPGVVEVVEDGRTGMLAKPKDIEDLAAKLDSLARDPGLRDELGSRGRATVIREYSIARVVDQLGGIYSKSP